MAYLGVRWGRRERRREGCGKWEKRADETKEGRMRERLIIG